jgi:CubicO group peptidase (beta-lactamase class C family)
VKDLARVPRNRSRPCTLLGWVVVWCVLLTGPVWAGAEPADLGTVLEFVRSQAGVPAVAAAAVRDGKIIAQGTVGVRAQGSMTPASPGDPFLIGSCAKSVMRLLVARQADAGIVSFDTTLGDALKDVPMREEYRGVTIRQILAHRGGIQPYTQIGPRITPWLFELTGSAVEQRAGFVVHVLNEPPAAPPGTEEVYSNAGFGIVAHLLERLAGRPWEELVREQVFVPLGMTTARIGLPTSAEHPDGVRGHIRGSNGYELTPGWREPLPGIAPAGMVSCSITDFARLAGELVRVEGGKPSAFLSVDAARDARESMPIGGPIDGVPFFGGEGTFTAAFALWPSQRLAIVVETNGGESDEVCQAAIEAVRAAVAPDAAALPELERESGQGSPGAATPPPGRGKLGIMLRAVNDALEIADVVPGSPAASSGLAKGDVILKINEKPVGEMQPTERMDALREENLKLTIHRNGAEMEIPIVRGEK